MKRLLCVSFLAAIVLEGCCTTGHCHKGRADHCCYGMGHPDGPQTVPAPVDVTYTTIASEKHGPIYFAFDSDVLDATAISQLDHLYGIVGPQGYYTLLEGHASSEGSHAYNMDLAQRRANSVMHYLVSKGVDSRRITTTSKGETQPAAPNTSPANRALNRRVEITLQGR